MAGLSSGSGGGFLPIVKINGKDGRVERSTYDGSERGIEIIERLRAIPDFATVQVGWLRFDEKPDMRLVALGDPLPERPGEDYKQGIRMVMMLPGELGLHELATTAVGVKGALDRLHDQVLASPEWKNGERDGQVPVVELTSWTREKTKFGPRAVPEFSIIGWKPRPDALQAHRAESRPRAAIRNDAPQKYPPSTGSTPIAPPQSAPVDLDDFG